MKKQKQQNTTHANRGSFKDQFSHYDILWIIIGILIFILLGYAVIHFDIVSLETFTSGMNKYNISGVEAITNAK